MIPEMGFLEKTMIGTVVVFIVAMGFFTYKDYTKSEDVKDQKIYASMIIDNAVTTIENPVTDNDNDFFVITNEDKAFYVTIIGQDGQFSQTSEEVTSDTVQLSEMLKTAMNRANEPRPQSRTRHIPIFIH